MAIEVGMGSVDYVYRETGAGENSVKREECSDNGQRKCVVPKINLSDWINVLFRNKARAMTSDGLFIFIQTLDDIVLFSPVFSLIFSSERRAKSSRHAAKTCLISHIHHPYMFLQCKRTARTVWS
ncbi:hypothetical protein [Scandinavium sp.]|uniref:hypothetical protein n=1 Tax=Scandinavium sp. TaxID=2830653 RepID=UPI00289760C9|nr:hypothetical protein [Scandinavium sp.]